jgi:hypothetical protein
MYAIRQVAISGANGPRPPVFASGMNDFFGGWAPAVAGPYLGQRTGERWYNEAKEEIAEYDNLLLRARKIANKEVREQIVARYTGDPADPESALYRRNSVEANVREAEAYTPVNFLIFEQSRVQNRVEKLKDWNEDFKRDVETAERTWGTLPEPVVVERVVERPVPAEAGMSPLLTVALVGGVIVGGLALLGVFK